jgi:hypothetical protein
LEENSEIKPQGPVVYVFQIKLHPLVELDGASAIHLPEAGDARANAEAASVPVQAETFIIS